MASTGEKWVSKPGKKGEIIYEKRNLNAPIRVVDGLEAVKWLKAKYKKAWKKVELESETTEGLVLNLISKITTADKPRLHDIILEEQNKKQPIAFLSLRQDQAAKGATAIYGHFDHDYSFISHVWAQKAKYVTGFIANGSQTGNLKVWIDMVSIAQHPGDEQSADLNQLTEAIYGAAEFKIILDKEGKYFTRIWCLFEIANRIKSKRGQISAVIPEILSEYGVSQFDHLTMPQRKKYWRNTAQVLEAVINNGIDVSMAEATYEKDRVPILKWIENEFDSFEAFNQLIVDELEERIIKLNGMAGPPQRNPLAINV